MVISLKNINNQVIIDIFAPNLDDYKSGILRTTLRDLIKRDQVNIVINMSLVSSISTNVLGCLIAAQKKCEKRGGQISIYGLQPDILMIFYVIRLDEYIGLYNNETDALSHQNMLVKRRLKLVKR